MGGPGRPPTRTSMLQQRADQRRRDEDDILEMRTLLAEVTGQEIDDTFMETFSRGLAEETGALPPPRIVVDAIKESHSAEPRKIADAVRAYYRRPRPRPQPQMAQVAQEPQAPTEEPQALEAQVEEPQPQEAQALPQEAQAQLEEPQAPEPQAQLEEPQAPLEEPQAPLEEPQPHEQSPSAPPAPSEPTPA